MTLFFIILLLMIYTFITNVMSEELMKKTRVKRITWNDSDTDIKDGSSVVALEIQRDDSRQLCSGVIVHEMWIMTSATCFISKPSSVVIKYGTNDAQDAKGNLIKMDFRENSEEIEKIIYIHPSFAQYIGFLRYDIALIKLNESLKISDKVTIIGIESNSWPVNEKNDPEEIVCKSYGFGHKNRKHSSEFIMKYGRKCECFRTTPFGLCSMMTTANDRDTPCFGDTGGPLMCAGALVGIFSNIGKCSDKIGPIVCGEQGLINGYTYVQPFIAWIQQHVPIELTPLKEQKTKCEQDIVSLKIEIEKLKLEREKMIFESDYEEKSKKEMHLDEEGHILDKKDDKNKSADLMKAKLELETKEKQWLLKQKKWELEKKQWQEYLNNGHSKANLEEQKKIIEKELESLRELKQQLEDIKNEILQKQEEIDKRDDDRHREGLIVRKGEPIPRHHGSAPNTIDQSSLLLILLIIKVLCYG